MKALIEVADRKKAELIRRGLADPEVRALVKVMGALDRLPSTRMKKLTMQFVGDYFHEQNELARRAVT